MRTLPLLLLLVVTSCASRSQPDRLEVRPSPPAAVEPLEAVRTPELVRSYQLGRYADPHQPGVMHEQHPLYRVESDARWNLRPGPVRPLPGAAPDRVEAALWAPLTNDLVVAEVHRQRAATEQVLREAAQLNRAYVELSQVIRDMAIVATNHHWMGGRLNATDQRLRDLETELRRWIVSMTDPTNHTTRAEPESAPSGPVPVNPLSEDVRPQTNAVPAAPSTNPR